MDKKLLFLNEERISSLLKGREEDVLTVVEKAYRSHCEKDCMNPSQSFLRFPGQSHNRIIALPGYVGGESPAAGIKWISSFPQNISKNAERASAVIVLNSLDNGRPVAILDGALISARRTAASAALAVRHLHSRDNKRPLGIIGCGRISSEVVNFLAPSSMRSIIYVFDVLESQIYRFEQRLRSFHSTRNIKIRRVASMGHLFEKCGVVTFATTATLPHGTEQEWASVKPNTTILHLSLRDIPPAVIIKCDNVVDDRQDIFNEGTSVKNAEFIFGGRDFVRATLGEIICGVARPRDQKHKVTVFSPFGLGILDVALASFVVKRAIEENAGEWLNW